MNSKDDSIKVVIFFIVFAIVMLLWATLKEENKSYLNDPYLPDEGRSECITSPSGDCL